MPCFSFTCHCNLFSCKPMRLPEGPSSPHKFITRTEFLQIFLSPFWFQENKFAHTEVLSFQLCFPAFKTLSSSSEMNEIQKESWCSVLAFFWHMQVRVEFPKSEWYLDHLYSRY